MRINEIVYFSPNLKLAELDLTNKAQILQYFPERITGYYLDPIRLLVNNRSAFAAGAIECLLIDALSRYSSLEDGTGKRIKDWCCQNLNMNVADANNFYQFFRCGILHESHIKQFGQFSFDRVFSKAIQHLQGYMVVNPEILLDVLQAYMTVFIKELDRDATLYNMFLQRLKMDFADEIKLAQ